MKKLGVDGYQEITPRTLPKGLWREVAVEFTATGNVIKLNRKKHLVWVAPKGQVWSASTPSDRKAALHRHLSLLRKAGWTRPKR